MTMPQMIDPLKAFAVGGAAADGRPVPLVATRFDVDIEGGLATVVTRRVFRNVEAASIEATITFPVPVHAVLFDLQARVEGRVVRARARRRDEARATYEDAVERGRTAVLHEEVLRGVHMLSVAHLGPGQEIEVTAAWVAALTFSGDRGHLRIPLTVGQIYGRSPLPDSDDLVTGGPIQTGDLFVRCRDGVAEVSASRMGEGDTRIALDAPIDIFVSGAVGEWRRGTAADGRDVAVRVTPHGGGSAGLNVAVLVDRSWSMNSPCSHQSGVTKHQAVVGGLTGIADGIGEADIVDLWEFDDRLVHVRLSCRPGSDGRCGGKRLLASIARLGAPRGGTEIGNALSGTMAGSRAGDILLITDGQSHALDVHGLARRGRRITVVLVGEDSLQANVGHLAALSGGDIFVAAGDDVAAILATAMGALRAPSERPSPAAAPVDRVRVVRGNAVVEAEWRPAAGTTGPARAVAALAASLALPCLGSEEAAALAEAEGLVTHLTSLVLVDEASEVQAGIPATRKVALPASRIRAPADPGTGTELSRRLAGSGPQASESRWAGRVAPPRRRAVLRDVRIDWDMAPNQLIAGDLSALDAGAALAVTAMAAWPGFVALAQRLGVAPVALVIAALAQSQALSNRSAARVARAILGNRSARELRLIARTLGVA